jgi:hypothetical protein
VPAVTEAVLIGALQLVFWGAVLVAAASCTVFAVRHHAGRPDGDSSDPLFWDVFCGAAVIIPALLIPAVTSPLAGLALAAVTGASGVAAYRSSPQILGWYASRRRQREDLPARRAAVDLHDAVLKRWQRYELDPALAIDFPDMADVARPETAAFIKAMRETELLRTLAGPGYAPAVARLEDALRCAEIAAGAQIAAGAEVAAGTTKLLAAGIHRPGTAAAK